MVNDTESSLENQKWPSFEDYKLKSTDSFGADTALISGDLLKSCGNSCLFLIGVYTLEDSEYFLTLSKDFTVLIEG